MWGERLEFNPERAKALVAEWEKENGQLGKLTLSTSTSVNANKVAEVLQSMWAENLGLEVELMQSEFKVYLNRLDSGDFDMGFLAWYGDYLDPYAFLDVFRSTSTTNRARWVSEEYDSLLDRSFSSVGQNRKKACPEGA